MLGGCLKGGSDGMVTAAPLYFGDLAQQGPADPGTANRHQADPLDVAVAQRVVVRQLAGTESRDVAGKS
jgi:hypothetical protein